LIGTAYSTLPAWPSNFFSHAEASQGCTPHNRERDLDATLIRFYLTDITITRLEFTRDVSLDLLHIKSYHSHMNLRYDKYLTRLVHCFHSNLSPCFPRSSWQQKCTLPMIATRQVLIYNITKQRLLEERFAANLDHVSTQEETTDAARQL
jgi:hypothetical protein